MDQMGLVRQFLSPQIRPLDPEMVVVGPALTVLSADVPLTSEQGNNELPRKPFGLMLEALDDLRPNEVYLVSGGSGSYALWGELMSCAAAPRRCRSRDERILPRHSRHTCMRIPHVFLGTVCTGYGPEEW